jgi:hypothetical protein
MIPKPAPQQSQESQPPARLRNPFQNVHVPRRVKRFFWQGKLLPAFWTVASLASLVLNIVLIIVLISFGRQVFEYKKLIEYELIGGLYDNFALMQHAHIITDIEVNASIPIEFDLPVSSNTTVYLTKDVAIPNTWVALDTAGQGINLSINAPADITLPEGTPLDIQLTLTVPVSTTVPVSLPVHVDIPLSQTELNTPFVGLQDVVRPYRDFLGSLPDTWEETLICTTTPNWLCQKLFGTQK